MTQQDSVAIVDNFWREDGGVGSGNGRAAPAQLG
jgi:hypothetical protein